MVVETNWPYDCSGVTLSDTAVPISATGQSNWVGDIKATLEAVTGALGICYWEPGWVGNANLGSPCAVGLVTQFDEQAAERFATGQPARRLLG